MHSAGDRLDEHGPLVRQGVRHGVELRRVRDELPAPPAARVVAETGLETGGDVPNRDPVATVALLRPAGRARPRGPRGGGEAPGRGGPPPPWGDRRAAAGGAPGPRGGGAGGSGARP